MKKYKIGPAPAPVPGRRVVAVLGPLELEVFKQLGFVEGELDRILERLGRQRKHAWDCLAKKYKLDRQSGRFQVNAETGELIEGL